MSQTEEYELNILASHSCTEGSEWAIEPGFSGLKGLDGNDVN